MDIVVKDANGEHNTDEFFIDEPCVVSFFIGELGWLAQRWQAYMRHLKHDKFPEHKFFMMLNSQYHVLVQDFVDWTVDLPEEFYQLELETDCYEAPVQDSVAGSLTPPEVWLRLIEYVRQFYNVDKATEIWTPRGVNTWVDMQPQLFTKYTTEALMGSNRPIITVFPRGRDRASQRNVPEFIWHGVVDTLRRSFNVILCGTPSGSYLTNYQAPGVDNLIGKADLEKVLTILNNSALSVSSQSGPTHLSVLSMCPAYIIGHEQQRHTVDDNKFNTPTSFRYVEDYRAIDVQTILSDISEFTQMLKMHDEFNSVARRTLKPGIRLIASRGKTGLVGAILNYKNMANISNIVNLLDVEKLYLVGDSALTPEENQELTTRLGEYDKTDKIHWIHLPVEDSISHIKEKLDFVYVDAWTDTKTCEDYFYKLKPEGIFGAGDTNMWADEGLPLKLRRVFIGTECDIVSRYGEENGETGWFIVQGGPLRDSLKSLKDKKNLVGVEIGVFFGENSKAILDNLDMKMLYLIDPYAKGLVGEAVDDPEAPEYVLKNAKRLLKPYKDKITWVRENSFEATGIPNKLDFVYVDGDHSYEGALRDFEKYWPMIKKGGILGGHDFDNKAVVKAAEDYFDNQDGEYIFFTDKDQDGTLEFWVYKHKNMIEYVVQGGMKDFDKLLKQRIKNA